jgi:hypothetical protein
VIETVSHVLSSEEACFGMWVSEVNGHFVTRLKVKRGERLEDAYIDHGPSGEYAGKIPPMGVPSVEGENPVGLMLEMSEAHRHDLRWYRMAVEQQESSTLIKDVIRQEEEALLAVRNQSSFGPHQTTMRNGHNHEQVVRDFMEERAARSGRRSYAV